MQAAVATTTPKQAATPQQYPHTPEDLRKEPNYPIWVRLRSGDRGARDELVVKYAPLVKYVIGRMAISLPAAFGFSGNRIDGRWEIKQPGDADFRVDFELSYERA